MQKSTRKENSQIFDCTVYPYRTKRNSIKIRDAYRVIDNYEVHYSSKNKKWLTIFDYSFILTILSVCRVELPQIIEQPFALRAPEVEIMRIHPGHSDFSQAMLSACWALFSHIDSGAATPIHVSLRTPTLLIIYLLTDRPVAVKICTWLREYYGFQAHWISMTTVFRCFFFYANCRKFNL